MNLASKIAKVVSPLRRHAVSAGLAAVLVSPFVLSSALLQGDETASPQQAAKSPLDAAEILFRGAENAAVGQRFTLEVLIVNSGSTPLKDLEFTAKLDDSLEQPAKGRDHRATVAVIDPDDLRIVRLPLTPRKAGPGGLDITLRDKSGRSQQIRYVMPVAAEAQPPQSAEAKGASPLLIKITPLKEVIVDRANIVLLNVVNTDRKPMANKLDLVVAYAAMGRDSQLNPNPFLPAVPNDPVNKNTEVMRRLGGLRLIAGPSNPTRHAEVTLPALDAGERITLPVRLTARRIGELGIAVTVKNAPATALVTTRLPVRFDANAPIERLLPVRAGATVPTRLPQTLAEIPEVSLEDPHAKALPADEAFEHVGHLIEKINHVNTGKTDAYMEALARRRTDIGGLPFTLGDACRLPTDRGQLFQVELGRLRVAMQNPATLATQLPAATTQEPEPVIKARIAALTQVLEPEGPVAGKQMVTYLASLSHVDATRALAKLAISADDEQVRSAAAGALATRREADFRDVFVKGLEYPWPAVAQRTAAAIADLKLVDLAPRLVDLLDHPDPRAPQVAHKDGKKVTVVREVVRVNHLRNCLLCHSPANQTALAAVPVGAVQVGDVDNLARIASGPVPAGGGFGRPGPGSGGPLTAPVPLPNQALPTPTVHGGYGQFSVPDTLVSFDVTYLRQDFSVKLPVAGAQPWPDQQRFDFLVRTREVSEKDAQAYRELLRPKTAGQLSPYQNAAVTALRRLTGRDAEPTAAAWRQALAQKGDGK